MSERVKVTTKAPEAKKENAVSQTRKTEASQSMNSPVDRILFLQRTIGNRAVERLVKSGVIQTKLNIGQPGDKYEQEADRVADQVMGMPEPQVQRQGLEEEKEVIQTKPISEQITPFVQRQEEDEEENIQTKPLSEQITPLVQRQEEEAEEKEKEAPVQFKPISTLVQRQDEEEDKFAQPKFASPGIPSVLRQKESEEAKEALTAKKISGRTPLVTPAIQRNINTMRGGGKPLPRPVHAFFEPRFGADFSHVRIHNDSNAIQLNKQLNSQAFTKGNDIYFNNGKYDPGSSSGKHLLAHELTHVIQQNAVQSLQRRTDPVVQCPRRNAQAGLIHLHGSEVAAFEAAKQLYCQYCVNLVYIDRQHPNRLVQVEVPSGPTCCADPNRIFDDQAIVNNWNSWNRLARRRFPSSWNVPSGACRDRRCHTQKTTAVREVINYRNNILRPAIIRAASPSALPDHVLLPFVVFHGNFPTSRPRRLGPTSSLSILSYCNRGSECRNRRRCATDRRNLIVGSKRIQFNSRCRAQSSTTNPVLNPHIDTTQSNNIDDFILVTRQNDFLSLANQGRNVVLQSPTAPNDGSLSIYLSSGRYVNIEAQRATSSGRSQTQARDEQVRMGRGVLQSMIGVNRISGNNCPPENTSSGCQICTSSSTRTGTSTLQIQRKPIHINEISNVPHVQRKSLLNSSTSPKNKNTIQRLGNPITETDLPSPTARGITRSEQERRRFMREVYRRQVTLWTARGATYLHLVPPSDLVTLPGSYCIPGRTIQVHKDIRHSVINMINDARSTLRSTPAGSTGGTTNVGIRSGYRSATDQFSIWTRWAPEYYRRTRTDRRNKTQFPSGEHSNDAAQYLAEYTNQRVFSPGYSPHQHGKTIDVSYYDTSGWAPADTSASWISRWQSSWFYGWLRRNAFRYGFFQNRSITEPWHWEYRPLIALILRIIQALLDLLEPLIGQHQLWLGGDRSEESQGGE